MKDQERYELQFIARDLKNRNVGVRALYAQCGDDDGAAEQAISEAAKLIDQAAWKLDMAARAMGGREDVINRLRMSIKHVRERRKFEARQCEVVGNGEESIHGQ